MFTLKIPFGAYAPGQVIRYSIIINNQSMSDTDGYSYQFIKKLTFTATSPSRKQQHVRDVLSANSYNEKCLRLTNRISEGVFPIPSTPPSTEPHNIISVEYFLKVKIQISGCHKSCELKMPVIIGTIPIRESLDANQYRNVEPEEQLLPTAPDLSSPKDSNLYNDLPPSYNDISKYNLGLESYFLWNNNYFLIFAEPPSFVEAIHSTTQFVDTDVDERNRIVGFKPLYPMYNVNQYQ